MPVNVFRARAKLKPRSPNPPRRAEGGRQHPLGGTRGGRPSWAFAIHRIADGTSPPVRTATRLSRKMFSEWGKSATWVGHPSVWSRVGGGLGGKGGARWRGDGGPRVGGALLGLPVTGNWPTVSVPRRVGCVR